MSYQARRHHKPRQLDQRQAAREILEFIELLTRGISKNPGAVSVHLAEGRGTAHYEIRGPRDAIRRIRELEDEIFLLAKVAARGRGRTRVSLHLYTSKMQEVTQLPHVELEEFVSRLAKTLVDSPDEVVVVPANGDGFSHYDIQCEHNDVGTLLGRHASHVNTIRNIVDAAGAVRGVRATLQVLERDGDI